LPLRAIDKLVESHSGVWGETFSQGLSGEKMFEFFLSGTFCCSFYMLSDSGAPNVTGLEVTYLFYPFLSTGLAIDNL